MENKISKIGVFTSGGDAPGMNAALRAVVLDDAAPRIPLAPALRPCADVGILDEQPRWIDIVV